VRQACGLWLMVLPAVVAAQGGQGSGGGGGTLPEAAQAAQRAWLRHDTEGLVARSPNLVLRIPGTDPSAPLGRAQAAELLRRYLRLVQERSLDVREIKEVEGGTEGFVELDRRYLVAGTTAERRETLFLGFRRLGERWVLTELRSAP